MVERCKQRGSSKTASSSSSESVSAERRGSHAAGATAPCQGQEAVESAWLSEDSDAGEAEAAAGPSEDVPFYDSKCAFHGYNEVLVPRNSLVTSAVLHTSTRAAFGACCVPVLQLTTDAPGSPRSLDVRDEAWVAKRRQGRRSDAILSCPGCLTSVCLDCQQHAERDGHFRAMFVCYCRRAWSCSCVFDTATL